MDRNVELWSSNPGEVFHAEQVTDAPDLSAAVSLSASHDEAESEAFWRNVFRPAKRVVTSVNQHTDT